MKTETIIVPEINYRKCHACSECANNCPQKVFAIVPLKRNGIHFRNSTKKVLVVRPQNCLGCNKCVISCRHRAITLHQLSSDKFSSAC